MQLKDVKDEKGMIAFGEDFFERSAKGKRRVEQQWLLNIAFIAGDQLAKVNRHTGALDRIDVEYDPEWVVRVVSNRILPVYRALTSKLTKSKPMPAAKAHSREESDIQAARAAIKLEEHHWDTLKLDEKHSELGNWLAATGNVFYKQFWNPKKGDRIIDMEEMDTEAGLTEGGLPQFKATKTDVKADFNLGDTDLVLRTPFNIYPQPGKTKLRDMRMIGDAEIMDADEIFELYGKEVQPVKDTKFVKINSSLSQTIDAGMLEERAQDDNTATVKELYILPCRQFPGGLVFRWAGDVILSTEENCSELPFTHFGLIEVPGRFWYKDIVEDLVPIQRRWNQLLSKIEMHNNLYNDPPVIIDPRIIDIDDWTNEPGSILEKKSPGGDPPFVMPVPQLDMGIFRELEILDQQFEIIPVLNKVSYGKDTPNAKSGVAINFLQEKDNDVIRPLIDQIEAGYAEVFKKDFKLCQANYEEDRGFAVVGEDNKVEWIEFSKADLFTNLDVGVEPGSAMPRSKVAQQALVMDMLEAGFFTDPQTGKPNFAKALKYMEFGSVDDIYQDNALDTNQAQRENDKMKDGVLAHPEEWHNHEAHVYEHNRLRKTADFEQFDDSVKQLFAEHITTHQEFMKPPPAPLAAPPGMPPTEMTPPGEPMPPEPAQDAGPAMPGPEELMAFLQQLPPEIKAQLQQMPPEQQMQAVMELYSQVVGGGAPMV